MSDNPVLEPLRAIRGDATQLRTDMVEVKERLGFLEARYASPSRRVDRLSDDAEQIKRRLDIVDVPAR